MALITQLIDAVWLCGTFGLCFLLCKTIRLANTYRAICEDRKDRFDRVIDIMIDAWGPKAAYEVLHKAYEFGDDINPPKSVKPSEVKSAVKDIKKVMEATE